MVKISRIEIFKNFLEKERPLNKGILTKLESNLKTNFIYNSNAIEGSTLRSLSKEIWGLSRNREGLSKRLE